ncbi:MAG TPA: hypothetical protein VFQ61_08690, partial [Polyangiaceae bacterium]|nr:hypothetical protein [Polyangiaceae bacterium]
IKFSPTEFLDAVEKQVIEPMRSVQKLLDVHPYVTRLYTTMSAEEMTEDPLFTFNPDLQDLNNIHTADRVIECSPELTQFEAPWRVELPQGGVVRGTGAQAQSRTWPSEVATLPANLRVLKLSSSGEGKVVLDNTDEIEAVTQGLPQSTGGSSQGGSAAGGSSNSGASPGTGGAATGGKTALPNGGSGNRTSTGTATGTGATGGSDKEIWPPKTSGSSGCTVAAVSAPGAGAEWLVAGLAMGLRALRRRARRDPK